MARTPKVKVLESCILTGVVSLYGWRTSNFVEGSFGTQLVTGMRSLHSLAFIEAMCSSFVDGCYARSENAVKWTSKNILITLGAMAVYDKQSGNVGVYSVQHASADISYVYNASTIVPARKRINTTTFDCTCPFMGQLGIPCRHLIAALHSRGQINRVFDSFAGCYKVAAYAVAFQGKAVFIPLESEVIEDATWSAPLIKKQPGRPRMRRIRSSGELTGDLAHKCSKCKQIGHNKRSCSA